MVVKTLSLALMADDVVIGLVAADALAWVLVAWALAARGAGGG